MGDIQFNGTPEEWDALVKKNKKEETLEEAAKKFADDCTLVSDAAAYKGFIEGAKWQQERMYSEEPKPTIKQVDYVAKKQERMYSEEEVDKLISIIQWYDDNSDVRPDSEIFMWFEQFKKK